MAYTPTNWTTGDTITATKLNKLENGVAGSALIVTSSNITGIDTMDKTVQEIYDALASGTPAFLIYIYGSIIDDFAGEQYLCPIMGICRYGGISDQYRIAVSCPKMRYSVSGISNKTYIFKQNFMVFRANSLSDYPTFYTNATVADSSLSSY